MRGLKFDVDELAKAATAGGKLAQAGKKVMSAITGGIKETGTTGKFTKSVKDLAFSKVRKDLPQPGGELDTFEITSSGEASSISEKTIAYPNQDLTTPVKKGKVTYQPEDNNPSDTEYKVDIDTKGMTLLSSGHVSEDNPKMVHSVKTSYGTKDKPLIKPVKSSIIKLKDAPTATAKSRGAMSRSTRQSIELPEKKPKNQ